MLPISYICDVICLGWNAVLIWIDESGALAKIIGTRRPGTASFHNSFSEDQQLFSFYNVKRGFRELELISTNLGNDHATE